MTDPLYSRAFYEEQSAGSLASARIILAELRKILPFRSAVDVGCGVAPWLRTAIDLGAQKALGIDGDYVEREHLLVDSSCFQPCDLETGNLAATIGDHVPFDLAICVEVAEHLTGDRAPSFIAELCSLSDIILFSAAIPLQGGTGHVNEQWPGYWSALFAVSGFDCFDVLRPRLWDRDECEWWYLQNALIFARRETQAWNRAAALGPPAATPPMSLIHPRALPHVKYAAEHIALELAQRTHEIAELQHALADAREGTNALKASRSWQITAPLRAVSRRFSRWNRSPMAGE